MTPSEQFVEDQINDTAFWIVQGYTAQQGFYVEVVVRHVKDAVDHVARLRDEFGEDDSWMLADGYIASLMYFGIPAPSAVVLIDGEVPMRTLMDSVAA